MEGESPLKRLGGPTNPPSALKAAVKRTLARRGLLGGAGGVRRALGRGLAYAASIAALVAAGAMMGRAASPGTRHPGPHFALLLYEDSTFRRDVPVAQMVAEYAAWADSLRERGAWATGERLADTGAVLVRRDGEVVVEVGGIAAAAALGGFYILRAATEAEALRIARDCPHLKYGGRIALRRIEPT